jgi:hypothetical protein
MRLPDTIASKYSKNALGDDPLSSAAKSCSTDSMNIDDATYADAPKHPMIDRPINPVAKMISQGGIKPWATTSCRNLGETSQTGQLSSASAND